MCVHNKDRNKNPFSVRQSHMQTMRTQQKDARLPQHGFHHPRCDKLEKALPSTLHFIVWIISDTVGGSGEETAVIGLEK